MSNKTITILGVTAFVALAAVYNDRMNKVDKEGEQLWKEIDEAMSKSAHK